MRVRFHRNEEGEPHIHDHGVEEWEVHEALQSRLEQVAGRKDSTIFIGRTVGARVLRIIFSEARDGDGIFVVTAYDLPAEQASGSAQTIEAERIMKKKNKTTTAKISGNRPRREDVGAYPKGWTREQVKALAHYYDHQSDDEAIAEAEAAYRSTTVTMMAIPVELVPKVQKLLAKRAG